MRVRPGHIQGNGAQGVCGPPGGPCAVLRPILSKRGYWGTAELSRCLRQKQAKRSRGKHSDRVLRTKQGAVFGAALRFLQAPSAVRRKNRLSARGMRSVFCKGATTPAAKTGNRNQKDFCRAAARRNWSPLEQSQKILQMPDPGEISSSSFRFGKARVFSSEYPPTLPL